MIVDKKKIINKILGFFLFNFKLIMKTTFLIILIALDIIPIVAFNKEYCIRIKKLNRDTKSIIFICFFCKKAIPQIIYAINTNNCEKK